MKQKILNLLGLATRAGLLVSGEDIVIDAMRKKKAKIVFLGSDCSENTLDKFTKKCLERVDKFSKTITEQSKL